MRWVLFLVTALVFIAFWLFDLMAMLRLGQACLNGECGIPSNTLAWIAGIIVGVWLAMITWQRLQLARKKQRRRRRTLIPAPKPKSRR